MQVGGSQRADSYLAGDEGNKCGRPNGKWLVLASHDASPASWPDRLDDERSGALLTTLSPVRQHDLVDGVAADIDDDPGLCVRIRVEEERAVGGIEKPRDGRPPERAARVPRLAASQV